MRKKNFLMLAVFAAATLTSCATAPSAPAWVLTTPAPDGSNTYFVGSGSGPDQAAAIGDATNNLIASIMQYMGVSVKVNTSAAAAASLDAYSASLRQTVETQSTNRLSGFQVTQKYVQTDKAKGKVTVYILASYATAELNKEKARIAALFQEKIDAVAKPEAEGDAFASEGRTLDAVNRYMEAMAAASGSDIENAEIKLERNANKARAQVASLRFSVSGGPELRGNLGTVPKSVEISLASGASGMGVPVPGASILLTYPRKLANGKLGTKTEKLVTDASGTAHFALPAPDFVGKGKISFKLDLSSSLDLLDKVPHKYDAILSALEDEIGTKVAELPYIVTSSAASVPMAVFVVDFDERGFASQLAAMQTGLMETLGKEGYALRVLALDPSYTAMPADQLAALARGMTPAGTGRLAYGSGRIDAVRPEGSLFAASASGSLKVIELATGRVLYAADKSCQALAPDEASARRNALRDLGAKIFGADIAASLP